MAKKTLYDIMFDAPLYGEKRRAKSRSDFGDDATVGLHVRKIGEYENAGPDDRAWGLYLGMQNGKFCIGSMTTLEMQPSQLEEYNSLAELKRVWELD